MKECRWSSHCGPPKDKSKDTKYPNNTKIIENWKRSNDERTLCNRDNYCFGFLWWKIIEIIMYLIVGPHDFGFRFFYGWYGPSASPFWSYSGAFLQTRPNNMRPASLLRGHLRKNQYVSWMTYKIGGYDYILGRLLAGFCHYKIFSSKHDTIILEKPRKSDGKPSSQLPSINRVFLHCNSFSNLDFLEKINHRYCKMARR